MIRKRLTALAAAAGLGLLSGCASSNTACSSSGGFLSRLTGRTRTVEAMPVVESGAPSCCEGPALMDSGPVIMPSAPGGIPLSPCAPTYGGAPLAPFGGAPLAPMTPMAPPPRLVPEPQAQARPYNP